MRKGELSFFAEVGIEVAVTIGVTKNRNYYKATILKGEMKVDSQKSKVAGETAKRRFLSCCRSTRYFHRAGSGLPGQGL